MYTLVSAMGKSRLIGGRWTPLEIGALTLASLFENYEKIYAVLTNPFYPTERCLDLDTIKDANLASLKTFDEFLVGLDVNSLTTTEELPKLETKHVIFSDLFRARYKVQPVSPNTHPDVDAPMGERDWLALSRANTDMLLFFKSCLVTVNGLIHLTDANSTHAFVVDGMKSCRHSKKASIGALSFREVGELEFVPITEQMIHSQGVEPLKHRMYVNVGVSRPTKTAMLVLGGYLHVLDSETFYQVNDTTFVINFERIPLLERFFDTRDLIDLSSLELINSPGNDREISRSQLYSDEVLKKYATLTQSFIVFTDTEDLFVDKVEMRTSRHPRLVIAYTEPKFPIITPTGRMVDYWRVYEHGQWAVTFINGVRNNYGFNHTPPHNLEGVTDQRIPSNPASFPRLRELKIGTDTLTLGD